MSSTVRISSDSVINFVDNNEKAKIGFSTSSSTGKTVTLTGDLILDGGGGFTTGTLSLGGGSITDTTGAISFGNENLTTTGTMTSAQFNMNSDKNLKKDIQKLTDDFDNILKLNPVNFKWKEHFSKNTNTQVGFIAQEVEKIYPDLVETDDKFNLTVNYIGFIPLMIVHIQKLHKLINTLTQTH